MALSNAEKQARHRKRMKEVMEFYQNLTGISVKEVLRMLGELNAKKKQDKLQEIQEVIQKNCSTC